MLVHKKQVTFFLGFLLALGAEAVRSESLWLGAGVGLSEIDAESSEFDTATQYQFQAVNWFTPYLGLQAGYSLISNAEEKGSDNRGQYKVTLESDDLFIGPVLSTARSKNTRFYAGGGFLYSKVDIEVAESFYNRKPGGTVSSDYSGTGFYLQGGVSFALNPKWEFFGDVIYRNRIDILNTYRGDIDIADTGLTVGVNRILN